MSDPLVFVECENKKNPSPVLSAPEFFYDEENVKKYQQHIAWNGKVGYSTENKCDFYFEPKLFSPPAISI